MASLAVSTSLFVKCARACSGIILTPVRFRQKGFVRRPQKVIYPKPEAEVSPSLNTEPLGEPVGEPRYVKLGSDDDEFANTMMLLKVKRKREKLNKVLLEGRRLIGDALKAGVECETIYFTLPENLEGLPLETLREDQIKKVFYKKMKIWSDLTTSPGIMGVFKKPSMDDITIQRTGKTIPVSVLCDNVRDPGNMGALIRSAAAAGCSRLLLSKGCVDPWELKVLRAGAGSHFRIPIHSGIAWEHMPSYVSPEMPVYLADNYIGRPAPKRHHHPSSKKVINWEGDDSSDSEQEDEDGEENEEEDPRYRIQAPDGQGLRVDKSYQDVDELEECAQVPLPHHEYTAVQYAPTPSILVVGGETQGLSLQAHKLAVECAGARVHVPASNGVESLNTAVAASIILYEMRRQMLSSCGSTEEEDVDTRGHSASSGRF